MKRSIRLLLAAAVVAAAVGLAWHFRPSEENRIRKAIGGMAADAT